MVRLVRDLIGQEEGESTSEYHVEKALEEVQAAETPTANPERQEETVRPTGSIRQLLCFTINTLASGGLHVPCNK